MKFFHGTDNRNIKEFILYNRNPERDFGKGLYLTSNFNQAKEWSCRYSKIGAIYEFEINLDEMKLYDLSEENDLYYIIYLCRIGLEDVAKEVYEDFENADVVSGYMLDGSIDKFREIAEKFNEGDITDEEFISKIKMYEHEKNQICIKTEKRIEEINACINRKYYTKKVNKTVVIEESYKKLNDSYVIENSKS